MPLAFMNAARLMVNAERPAEAASLLKKIQARHKNYHSVELLRGAAEADLQHPQSADQFIDRSDRANQKLPTPFEREIQRISQVRARFGLPRWLKEQEVLAGRQPEAAEKNVRDILRQHWNPDLADFLADLQISAGRPQDAVRLLQQVVEREGAKPYYLWRLGGILELAGEKKQAIEECERALRMGPELADELQIYERLAAAYATANDEVNAQRCRAARRGPPESRRSASRNTPRPKPRCRRPSTCPASIPRPGSIWRKRNGCSATAKPRPRRISGA